MRVTCVLCGGSICALLFAFVLTVVTRAQCTGVYTQQRGAHSNALMHNARARFSAIARGCYDSLLIDLHILTFS